MLSAARIALAALALLPMWEAIAEDSILSPSEIAKMAEAETAKTFNEAYKAKIQKEALEKLPDIKIGDKITVPVRFGASYADKTGILRAVGDDAIMVNIGAASDKKILKVDLGPDLRAAIEGENIERRSFYMLKYYTQARANFKKSTQDRLYHENGYVYDADQAKWTPKIKDSLPASAKAEEPPADDNAPVTEIATLSGEVFTGVTIQKISPEGIEILHSNGATTIKLEMLPEKLRKRFAAAAAAASSAKE